MIPGKDYVGLGVGALIVRNGKVLMLLRTDACRNNRGMWTIPGGEVETFERLEDAVKREVKEETGLTVTSPGVPDCLRPHFRRRALGQHFVPVRHRRRAREHGA